MCSISDNGTEFSVLACSREEKQQGEAGRREHSLQSCEKSLVGGKWKVGEEGLVTMAGAELMPLDTTEDAGTWRARRSALGLVGSSVGGGGRPREGRGLGIRIRGQRGRGMR